MRATCLQPYCRMTPKKAGAMSAPVGSIAKKDRNLTRSTNSVEVAKHVTCRGGSADTVTVKELRSAMTVSSY